MSTRRDALRLFTIAPAALPALGAQETKELTDQPGHVHTGPTVQMPVPSQPTFLQPAEFRLIEALTERIIPRSDTPGAKDAGVALLIDKAIVAARLGGVPLEGSIRAGLADINTVANQSYGQDFTSLTEEQQVQILLPLSLEPDTPLGKFFTQVKNMTIDAYYRTEAGLKTELGWHGNTFLPSFSGCDHPEHQS